jgi:hypothetical protein
VTEQQLEVERLEAELFIFKHQCCIDWRELHELETLMDLKIRIAIAKQAAQATSDNAGEVDAGE